MANLNFGERMAIKREIAKGKRQEAAKSDAKAKAPMSAGIGESQRFGGTHERVLAEGEVDWSKLTLNGLPIPEDLHGRLPYFYTDQAIAEREAKRDPNAPHVEFLRDQQDKVVDKYADGLADGIEPWEGGIDPLAETLKPHQRPGERYHYVSQAKVSRDGWRGWQPVETVVGGVTTMVKIGTSILARMSEDRAKKRDRFMRDKAREQMVQATEKVQELRDQSISERSLKNIARRRRVDENEGFQSVYGDERETDDRDFQSIQSDYESLTQQSRG